VTAATRARDLMREIRTARDLFTADRMALTAVYEGALDDDDVVLAMLLWEETHEPGIVLDGLIRFESCVRGPKVCTRCHVSDLWHRAAGSCPTCYGRGVVDSYVDGRGLDVDVSCRECKGTGDRR
jgi:hypothetical protein